MNRWFWPISVWVMFILVLLGGLMRPSKQLQDHTTQKKTFRVGLVLSVGGRGDQSFNDSAYHGLMQAKKLFRGVQVRFSEPRENAAARRDLENFASQGYDLIIGVGFLMARAVKEVAKRYPKQSFAIIDSVVSAPNVASLVFQEHEGSYLAGVLAALASRTNVVAFLGGMNTPLIRKFEAGFTQGALDTKPSIKVLSGYIGASPKAFHDPDSGEKLAITQFGRGADIIFHASGSSGLGAIKAAREWNKRQTSIEKKRYIIGVDGNQDAVAPGSVLTSMLKRVDISVFEIIKNALLQRFEPRVYRYGLSAGGVDVTDCRYSRKRLPKDFQKQLARTRLAIIQGKRYVPSQPEQVKRTPLPKQPATRPTKEATTP
ncbi:MAG: BMP family ABC transporter substrate-binding protein [Deltaproteobacteria bacterium]|nr:BMP family ABC transporter substrate-binding protein [Deltaproteobacteria bacterium]MBU54435.1 BMP family ABC transporter substrate-binding protein [Deltaproteobacteria bacterium]